MSDLLAGRAQMGTSLAFHIVFACLGVGLPVMIAMAHFAGLRRDDAVWMRLAERLTRAFTVLVVIGVISGIVISIELSLLWPSFMEAAGPVIGVPISIETYAFFMEVSSGVEPLELAIARRAGAAHKATAVKRDRHGDCLIHADDDTPVSSGISAAGG